MPKNTLLTALGLSVSLAAPLAAYDYSIVDTSENVADFSLRIDTVRSASEGVVEIYDYRLGVRGDALGATSVQSGANSDVRIPLATRPLGDVVAVLYDINGRETAKEIIEIVD